MKAAIIAPVPHLDVARLSDFHLVLAPLVLEDEYYAQFYRERALAGDYIILDNGVAESGIALDVAQIERAAEVVPPSEVVIPDAWLDSVRNIHLFRRHVERLRHSFPEALLMAIAQGGSLGTWFWCWDYFMSDARADVIGLPKNMTSPKGPFAHPRCKGGRGFVTRAIDLMIGGRIKPHHVLGTWYGLQDIYELRSRSWVRSIDTSFPSVCAQYGVELTTGNYWNLQKPAQKLDFHSDAGPRELHVANAKAYLKIVAGER